MVLVEVTPRKRHYDLDTIHRTMQVIGCAEDKIEAMRSAGIAIADSPASLGTTLASVLKS